MATNINWDEAITTNSGFVNLEGDAEKKIKIKNWRFEKTKKFGEENIEFQADCIEEDGQKVEKIFNTVSNRLKTKLRPILEKKVPTDVVHLSIIKVGTKFDTQFSVALN